MGDARHLGRAGGAGSDIWIVRMTTIAPESSTVKRALSAHAAIGLLAGALLYIVSLSGTLAVFYQEFQRIEQPRAPELDRKSTRLNSSHYCASRMPSSA